MFLWDQGRTISLFPVVDVVSFAVMLHNATNDEIPKCSQNERSKATLA